MLRPVKRAGGRRYYRPADVELLQTIDRLLNNQGYTIRGAIKAIEEGPKEAAAVPPEPAPSADMVARLRGAVRTLEEGAETALPDKAEESATRSGDLLLRARLMAIREKLASALID